MNATLKNDGLWGSYYDAWSAQMEHVVRGLNLDIYLAAIPLIRDWRAQFVQANYCACKGKRYNIALKHELTKPVGKFHKLTVKEFSELVWLSNDGDDSYLAILAELRAARAGEPGLRDINSPKAAAKIVRKRLKEIAAQEDGSAEAERIDGEQEADAAEALADKMMEDEEAGGGALVALMRRYTKNPDRIMEAFAEAFADQPSFVHSALVRALEEMRVRVNDIIENENRDRVENGEKPVDTWGGVKGGFFKPMRAHKLLKQPCRG